MSENITEYTANFCLLVMEYIEDYKNVRESEIDNAEISTELPHASAFEKVSCFFKNLSKKAFFHCNK